MSSRSPFLQMDSLFRNVKNLSGGVRHEGGQMRLLRRVDEKERQDLFGGPEMEVRRVRRFGHRALRRRGRPPRGVPVVVAVEGHAARDAGRRPDFQAQDFGVLGGLAHARAR